MTTPEIAARLAYLRSQIVAERISWYEIGELQSLAEHVDPSDMLLREWADVHEFDVDYVDTCIVCGDPIDYCQGHGEIGDPEGFAILQAEIDS